MTTRVVALGVVTIVLAVTVATWGVRTKNSADDEHAVDRALVAGSASAAPSVSSSKEPTAAGDIVAPKSTK